MSRTIAAETPGGETLIIPQLRHLGLIEQPGLFAQAARMLAGAVRPVIMVGGGIKTTGAAECAIALAEAVNAPLVSSPGHGDAIPFGHPLDSGQTGPRGNAVASRLVKEADVILALGTRIGFYATFYSHDNINRDAAIIHVEQEPTAIRRYFPVALGIWGDAPTVAEQLRAEAEKPSRRAPFLPPRQLQAQGRADPVARGRARGPRTHSRAEMRPTAGRPVPACPGCTAMRTFC